MAVPRVAGPLLQAIAATTAWLKQANIPAAVIGGANGLLPDWTRHGSSQLNDNYKRSSRKFYDLGLGELLPPVDALPELMTPASAAL